MNPSQVPITLESKILPSMEIFVEEESEGPLLIVDHPTTGS